MENENKSQVAIYNAEIKRELGDPAVGRALLATTFKGLSENNMKQALLEGMIRGHGFKDFLVKNIYAVPFGSGYSLVTSIDLARKDGAKGGVIGSSVPVFVDDDNGNPVTCSVTVYTHGGHPEGYTSIIYFREYSTGKNLWLSKPHTMIAKVAEMHALRKACPQNLSQVYVEEEFEHDPSPRGRYNEAAKESGELKMGSLSEEHPSENEKQEDQGKAAEGDTE